jgi:Uma2 family endonuclease
VAATESATIADLYAVPEDGKAELVDGRVVLMPPAGGMPNRAGFKLTLSLYDYERRTGLGRAFTDNAGFRVDLPNRGSFSPDASFHTRKLINMKFLEGAPVFAVEVRSGGTTVPPPSATWRPSAPITLRPGRL